MPKSLTVRDKSIVFIVVMIPVITITTNILFSAVYEDYILLRNVQSNSISLSEPVADKLAEAAKDKFPPKEQSETVSILVNKNKFNQADKVLEGMLKKQGDEPDKRQVLLMLCRNSANAGWYDKAIEQYQKYLSAYEDDYDAVIEYAGVLFAADKKEKAMDLYIKSTEIGPDSAEVNELIADIAFGASQNADNIEYYLGIAESSLSKAIELSPDKSKWRKMAILLSYQKKYSKALDVLAKCQPVSPSDREMSTVLASAINGVDDIKPQDRELFQNYISLLDIDAVEVELLCPVARASVKMGYKDEAVGLFEKYLQINPRDRAIRYEFANYLHNEKEYNKAEKHYTLLLDE